MTGPTVLSRRPSRLVAASLAAGALATGVAVLLAISNLPQPGGGLDRAAVGWLVVLPLLLAAPALAGVGGAVTKDRGFTTALILTLAILSGACVGVWLYLNTQQLGCSAVDDRSLLLLPAATVGFTASVFFVAAAATGYVLVQRAPANAFRMAGSFGASLAAGFAGAFAVLVVWTWMFPIVSCRPLP